MNKLLPDVPTKPRTGKLLSAQRKLVVSGTAALLLFCGCSGLPSDDGQSTNPNSSNPSATRNSRSPLQIPRMDGSSVVLDGLVYVIGGYSGSTLKQMEAYDPSTNTWTTKASLSQPRRNFVAGVINGKIYVTGGMSFSDPNNLTYARTTEVYDPATDKWKALDADFPFKTPYNSVFGNVYMAGGALNGQLYVASYNSQAPGVTEAYSFDPSSRTWTQIASPPSSTIAYLDDFSVACSSTKLYAYGAGRLSVYDPSKDFWTNLESAPVATLGASVIVDGNFLYAIGGATKFEGNSTTVDQVQRLDLSAGTWTAKHSLASPRRLMTSVLLQGQILIAGGTDGHRYDGSPLATFEEIRF